MPYLLGVSGSLHTRLNADWQKTVGDFVAALSECFMMLQDKEGRKFLTEMVGR